MKSYSQSDVALYVITAVMEGNCYELLSGSGNVENNSHCQKVYIRESVLLFNFLFALRSTHSYWCQWRIIYSESERDTWIKSGTGEFVTIGRPQKMFKNLNYSFKYFCVIYSRSLFNLSFKIKSMLKGYMQCLSLIHENVPHSYLILFFFYLTASCKEMYLGLCDKRCSHDFIRLVGFFQFFFKLSCKNWVQL